MSNPFEKVPSSADVPGTIDKKTVSALSGIADRFEKAASRNEAIVKNEEELAGVIFDLLLDDDGSVKDLGHAAEIRGLIDEAWKQQERGIANLGEIIRSIPTSVRAELGEEDRKLLDSNFRSWKGVSLPNGSLRRATRVQALSPHLRHRWCNSRDSPDRKYNALKFCIKYQARIRTAHRSAR